MRFRHPDTGHTLVFLTNLFGPTPKIICELYKALWQVAPFFKWICASRTSAARPRAP